MREPSWRELRIWDSHLWWFGWSLLIVVTMVTCETPGEGCDWSGSGLETDPNSRGIQPVYLRCAQGHVEWQYPRGALRVVLRQGTSGRDFSGCVKVAKHFKGARIYLEGHRKLQPLFATNDGKHRELFRCFYSYKGQVALYVEAEPIKDDLFKSVAAFSYDLQSLPRDTSYDPLEDCRPCSESELLRAFCTSDFVVKGIISSVYNNDDLQRTEVVMKANKVYRQNVPVFHSSGGIFGNTLDMAVYNDNGEYGTVHIPLKCGAKQGSGEFFFMGSHRLGEPILRCAPRVEEWIKIVRKANKEGIAQCVLES